MTDQTDLQAYLRRDALKDLVIEYWRDVDANDAARALDFYTEDCLYLMCGHRMRGHADIAAYYEHRRRRGKPRLVRHLVSNLRAHADHPDRGWVEGSMTVYADDGAPVLPAAPPILVADIAAQCLRGADGRWRFQTFTIAPLFMGGVELVVPPSS
ncbi:YybH family protein [Achromobacter aloeverae]|uniref:YybH family protein n=1 Tax=Achromobacter aloeverae TaxID=1750518 RepID=UPI001301651F|nr:nuclear transport factor 2 family protein [Achromobacter aloeverae]